MSVFERYLSVWVALCIVVGIAIGRLSLALVGGLSRLEVSHVNLPIAVLIWLMIYPMMLRIDFAALRGGTATSVSWTARSFVDCSWVPRRSP